MESMLRIGNIEVAELERAVETADVA